MMKPLITSALTMLLYFSAMAQTSNGSFMYDGLLRDYILFAPSGYDGSQPFPLVINMHGYTSNASQQMFYTGFNSDADTAGYFMVYPNGVNNAWNSGFNVPYNSGIDDVGFLSALIDTISGNYNIDPCRVFSTGMSNGGFMSYRLACELENKIAAIASVTGSMTPGMVNNCTPSRPVAIMQFHGTDDPTVPYDGQAGVMTSQTDNFNFWAQQNNCVGAAITSNIPDIANDGTTVEKIYFTNCGDSTEVILYKINGGTHTWPDAVIEIGVTTYDVSANSEILKFFNRHPRCAVATSLEEAEKNHTPHFFPNPTNGLVHLNLPIEQPAELGVFEITGNMVFREHLHPGSKQINLDGLKPGVYMLNLSTNRQSWNFKIIKQ